MSQFRAVRFFDLTDQLGDTISFFERGAWELIVFVERPGQTVRAAVLNLDQMRELRDRLGEKLDGAEGLARQKLWEDR